METFVLWVGVLQAMLVFAVFVALIYLIVKRVEEKREETFEKRDN